MLYRVELSYMTIGIEVEDDIITEAPPIARWMVGKGINYIENWVTKKHGKVTRITKELEG